MKRIRISRPRPRRERPWEDDLPADPRDPDIVRAKALAAYKRTGSSRSRSTEPKDVRNWFSAGSGLLGGLREIRDLAETTCRAG
jgi:hypothetical protein